MPAYNRAFLSPDEKEKFSRRLSHYLEDHTYKNRITHAEAAKKMGISQNKFSQLKSGVEQGRFMTSLDYLKSLAQLENMHLPEFISYLDGNESQTPDKKYDWQDKIYRALEHIGIPARKRFADAMINTSRESGDKVELLCRALSAMSKMDVKALEGFVNGFEKLSQQEN